MSGKLILAGTPIGNLEDASPRLLRTLEEADVVACEDTRRTRKLLSHFGVSVRDLVVYNESNERRQADRLAARMARGHSVVLVSDAGMPGLSDPGFRIVRAAIEGGHEVIVVPGPSASLSALAISGLFPGRFVFEGFLPRKSSERRRHLADMADEPRTLIFYESPHRVTACLADMHEVLGDRSAAVARELTKLHEEVRRGRLSELLEWAESHSPRGELVIVIEGNVSTAAPDVSEAELAERARALMESGVERRAALSQVAGEAGVPRRKVFDSLLDKDQNSEF